MRRKIGQEYLKRKIESVKRNLWKDIFLARKIKKRNFCVFLLPDAEMRKLKKRFLPDEKGPANVLSFPEPTGWPSLMEKRKSLGEIYLNKKILEENPDDSTVLLVHGLLHLLGYDHKKAQERKIMESLEKKLLKRA